MRVERFRSRGELDAALISRLERAIGAGSVMLSGGNTPRTAYLRLAQTHLSPGEGLALLFSDERYVPRESAQSNYRMAQPLIESLRLPDGQVLRVRTELPLEEAASDYDVRLGALLQAQGAIALGLLGLGADGHTASLFSPADLERSRGKLAIAVNRPDGMQAISVTPSLLERVDRVLIVATGEEKRAALAALLAQDPGLVAWQAVAGCPDVEVWCEAGDA